MTTEQLARALDMVASESLPEAVSLAAANELRYLAAGNVDPIPDDELAALTRHIVNQAKASNIIDAPAPVSNNLDTGSPAADNALYPTPGESISQMPNGNRPLDTVESVTASALVASGAVVFDPAGFEPFKLTIQAAVEALNALAAAVDELLTPDVGYRWQDLGVGSALLHYDPSESERFIDSLTPAEVHRDDAGAYVVSTRFGRENPDPVAIASVRDMETGKYVAAQAVREFILRSAAFPEARDVQPPAAVSSDASEAV